MASIGYGYTKPEVIHIANNYAVSVGKKSESDPTENIYNMDETNIPLEHNPQKLSVVNVAILKPSHHLKVKM